MWKLFTVLACDTWPIPLDTACQRKRLSHRQNYHTAHIMFSWDYLYLDDLCSVITLHVTVQRCSPNINSPILPPHGFERTVKLSFSVTASFVLSQSSHLPCLPNFFALIIDQNGHYFLVNSRVIESCIWFYCFFWPVEAGFVNTLILNLIKRNFYSLTDH